MIQQHSYSKAKVIVIKTILLLAMHMQVYAQPGASIIKAFGYDSCVLLKNETVSVIIDPNAGGRVLAYTLQDENVLYVDSVFNGWMYNNNTRTKGHLPGGRFDVGPSRTKVNTDLFFFGKWTAIITGKYAVQLRSQVDPASHIYLTRDFVLDENSSHLRCTQTIVNKGSSIFYGSHWSRTFGKGNGICILPVDDFSRFPRKYIRFENRDSINISPVDANISITDNCLVIKGPTVQPKLEMDVADPAWIAYASINHLLFVKKYKVFTDRIYGELTAANCSIWYNGVQMTEIEPIGPLEKIAPGASISFSEDWYLLPYEFPVVRNVDVKQIKKMVAQLK